MDPNEYFKGLAISHKDIKHTENKPAYFREYSSANILFGISDFFPKMGIAGSVSLVSQFNKDGNYEGSNDDSLKKVNTGTIYIIKKVKSNNIDGAFNDTYAIWQDIFTKIKKDEAEGVFNVCEVNFKFGDSRVFALGMIADGYYGIAVFINIMDPSDGSVLEYDPDKWS